MTRAYLRDPLGIMRNIHERHGPVVQMNLFGMRAIVLLGPDSNELVLRNSDDAFSSDLGWSPVVGNSFPNGLISMDGARHRANRRMIGAAFKPEPMRAYHDAMSEGIERDLAQWPEALRFYPAVKRLTLDLASRTLLGLRLEAEARQVSRAFVAMLGASTALVRRPVPGGALWRGLRGRHRLSRLLLAQIPLRRQQGGSDIFSVACGSADEDGRVLSDEAIVDHINLLLMAAHDTTTSALTSMAYMLGRHPEWQERVRNEMAELRGSCGNHPSPEGLRQLTMTDMVLSEVLRCMPPVPSLPRGLNKDAEFGGHRLPAGSAVGIHILHTHHMQELWPEPDRFDPTRFTPEQVRARHRYAWLPFGGGAHMCLGLHFASMQVKLFLFHLLASRQIVLHHSYCLPMRWLPIAHPNDGLPMRLVRC